MPPRKKNVGIQPNTTAASVESIKLDRQCKEFAVSVFEELKVKYPALVYKRKLNIDELREFIPHALHGVGFEPDGGIWFYNSEPIAVFEAKHQGPRGNAVERWYKNRTIARLISPEISYVTFATGEGASDGGRIEQSLSVCHPIKNKYVPKTSSIFLSVSGFRDGFIRDTIKEVVVGRIHAAED